MKIARFHVPGRVLSEGESTAVVFDPAPTDDSARVSLVLALVTLGVEEQLFPASLLDDWGNEVKGRAIYSWIAERGISFPRAEIFGTALNGEERQQFLREFDLEATLPCYLVPDEVDLAQLVPVRAIVVEGGVAQPVRLEAAPETLSAGLRQARVEWWQVPDGLSELSFLSAPGA
jgi:hypothetical protein